MNVDKIKVGERDREELGDIESLAKSISKVGLLHPVVVTADAELIAGGRRLEAVKSLGWTKVPVTIADLTTIGELLQAEADENTCRKQLTPFEASKARQRRIELLAPKAKANQTGGSKLDQGQAVGRLRKSASEGTGYSGSTLDKVDRIRDAAERGVIRQGKSETEAPPEVVETAKRALNAVKTTGAAVDRSSKDFEASVEAYAQTDPSVKRARLMKAFAGAQSRMSEITAFDVAAIADAMSPDDFEIFQTLKAGVDNWAERLDKQFKRPLRAVDGGNR